MSLSSTIFNIFKYNLFTGNVNSSSSYDTINCMLVNPLTTGSLTADSAITLASAQALTGFVESSGSGYTAGGQALSGLVVTQNSTSGSPASTAILGIASPYTLSWTIASGYTVTAQGCLLYQSKTTTAQASKNVVYEGSSGTYAGYINPVIAYLDFGGNISASGGALTLQWTNGSIITFN
jgi:hypothetical protein